MFPVTVGGGTTTGGGARSRETDSLQWEADPARQGLGGGELAGVGDKVLGEERQG